LLRPRPGLTLAYERKVEIEMFVYDVTANPLNNNEWSFPLLEILHIGAFAFSVGTIAAVDLRLLGVALQRRTSAELLKDTAPWTLWGLIVVLLTGPLIFSSDPLMYLHNWSFRFKMFALLVALIYNYTIHRKVAMENDPSGVGKLVAVLSLALWVSVVAGGLFIAFV